MPRVRITLHDLDEIEELEDLEDWEEQIGLRSPRESRDARGSSAEERARRRAVAGSVESRIRRLDERRKSFGRSARRH